MASEYTKAMIRFIFLTLLSIFGISLYVSHLQLLGDLGCMDIPGFDCQAVLGSQFARLFNIPTSFYGNGILAFYVFLAYRLLRFQTADNWQRIWTALCLLMIPSLGLLGIQAFILKAWCFWCVIVDLGLIGLWLGVAVYRRGQTTNISFSLRSFLPISWILLMCMAFFLWAYVAIEHYTKTQVNNALLHHLPAKNSLHPNPYGTLAEGNPLAKNMIVVFSDYECPSCKKNHKKLAKQLKETPMDLYIVYRHFPLSQHPESINAAKAATCANLQGKFSAYQTALYDNQKNLSPEFYRSTAQDLSLNMAQFEGCMEHEMVDRWVKLDKLEGRRFGIRRTPSLVVNGRTHAGSFTSTLFE